MKCVSQGCDTGSFSIEVIREQRKRIAEREAVYRLCACRFSVVQYAIEVIYGEERSAAYLGEDLSFSTYLFELLLCGDVTPCTLRDIVEDLRNF